MCDGLLCTKMVKCSSIIVQVPNVHAVNAKWLLETFPHQTLQSWFSYLCPILYNFLFVVLCTMANTWTSIQYQRTVHVTTILPTNQVSNSTCVEIVVDVIIWGIAHNHHNYTIVYVWYHGNLFIWCHNWLFNCIFDTMVVTFWCSLLVSLIIYYHLPWYFVRIHINWITQWWLYILH